MEKTRDLFKKSRDTKGTFHATMGTIKDRNGMDLTEAENIKKRWQEYTEELYKKRSLRPRSLWWWCDHSSRVRHPGMRNQVDLRKHHYKASEGDGIPLELFQRWYCESAALSMPANLKNSAVPTGLEKVSFQSNPKERQCQRMFKLLHNCIHFICYEGDTQKSFKLGLNNIWTENFQVY